MPAAVPIVAAVAGAVASAGAASALAAGTFGFVLAAGGFASALVSGLAGLVVSFAVSALGGALFGVGKKAASTAVQPLSGRQQQVREAASPRRVIIGRVKVSGPIIFVHARDADGVPNKYLYIVIALAGHAIQGFEEIFIDDTSLSDPKFAGLVKYEFKYGLADQTVPQWMIDETGGKWTADHRGRGCALGFFRLTYNETVFANGIPNISAVLLGKKLYDPRTDATTYSANPQLAVIDYLRSDYGLRESMAGIDDDTAMAGANICDEAVALKAGGTEPRYEAHGTYTLDEQPGNIIAKLLTACAGSATYAGGKWFVEPAAWRPSNRVITQGELRGAIGVQHNRPLRDLFNGVRATYVRPEAEWQETDAPVLLDAAARLADGGEPVYQNLELPFTTSGTMAQRIMRIALNRIRAQRQVKLDLMLHHVALRPGSVVTLDLPRQARETFRVTGWTLAEDGGGVSLAAEADNAAVYAWNEQTDEQALKPPSFADKPSSAAALTPTLTLTAPSAPVPASVAASWTAVSGALDYELSWRLPAGGEFTATGQAGTSATITTGDRAEMKVRARKASGFSEFDAALFPPQLERFVVAGAPGGLAIEFTGSSSIQVFTSAGTVFSAATLAGTLSGGSGTVSLVTATYNVWGRAIGAKGAVGLEIGPILATASDPATGGAESGGGEGTGGSSESEGGSGGET